MGPETEFMLIAPDEIRYESIKEGRSWYYVVYSPPLLDYLFASLYLTIEQEAPPGSVAALMETEAREWVSRYPLPVMVTALTLDEDRVKLDGARPCDHLFAWPGANGDVEMHWRLVPNGELPTTAKDKAYIHQLFVKVPHRTGAEIRAAALRYARQAKAGWWLVLVWAVVVPLAVAVLEWWSDLLGLVVLAFAFTKAGVKALRLSGKLPRSASEKEKEALDLRMRHHHYHCELNPEGFARLKAENFRKEAMERTRAEAASLRQMGARNE